MADPVLTLSGSFQITGSFQLTVNVPAGAADLADAVGALLGAAMPAPVEAVAPPTPPTGAPTE